MQEVSNSYEIGKIKLANYPRINAYRINGSQPDATLMGCTRVRIEVLVDNRRVVDSV